MERRPEDDDVEGKVDPTNISTYWRKSSTSEHQDTEQDIVGQWHL